MADKLDVKQGTLALMILKTLDVLGPLHGYGIARRIEEISKHRLKPNYGTLYPALLKLEQEGFITAEWSQSENKSPGQVLLPQRRWPEAVGQGTRLGTPSSYLMSCQSPCLIAPETTAYRGSEPDTPSQEGLMATLPRRAALFLLPLLLTQGPAHLRAQASGPWSGCKTDSLSNYNCAHYYTGTVSYNSELKTPDGTEIRSITATVTGGKVTCKVKTPDGPAFDGPGMLVAEHASTMTSGKYVIRVWCPESAGERATRRDSPSIDTYEQQAADYATLEGKDAHEHPDADSANGVSGTETIAWQLRR